jgi:hypothetical protein
MGMNESKHIFSESQSAVINAGAGSQSTNVWKAAAGVDDQGNTKYADFSSLSEMRILVNVGDTALVGSGAVLTIAVYEHTAATSIEAGNLIISKDITLGASGKAIGAHLADLILPQDEINEQYLGVYYSVATANITAGTITARAVDHREKKEYT